MLFFGIQITKMYIEVMTLQTNVVLIIAFDTFYTRFSIKLRLRKKKLKLCIILLLKSLMLTYRIRVISNGTNVYESASIPYK